MRKETEGSGDEKLKIVAEHLRKQVASFEEANAADEKKIFEAMQSIHRRSIVLDWAKKKLAEIEALESPQSETSSTSSPP